MRFFSLNPFRSHRGHHFFGHHFGRHHHHDRAERAAEFLEHIVHRAARKLDLNAPQQELLTALFTQAQTQRESLRGGVPELVKDLLAGDSFDRGAATQMLDAKLDALRAAGPGVINALGDFFDSLDAEQKQALRFMLRARQGRGC